MTNNPAALVKQNVTAPAFSLNDVYGRLIDLNQYRDKRVLVAFFRHAGCPFCNLRVHALSKEYESLKAAGLEMIFFFESKSSVILRSSFHQGVSPIPIISDPEKKWYDIYGLESSALKSTVSHITTFVQTVVKAKMKGLPVHLMADGESINTIPAEFLLDKNLIVKKLHYSASLTDRLELDVIRAFARTGQVVE
jgi:peroxiredoxin Q/BCP